MRERGTWGREERGRREGERGGREGRERKKLWNVLVRIFSFRSSLMSHFISVKT